MRVTAFYKIIIIISFSFVVFGCSGKTKEQLYAEGVKQINDGHPGAAIVFLKNALEKDQNFFDARYQLATVYTTLGKYEQSEKEFRKLARQNPSHPGIRLGLAKVHNSTNKPDLAIKEANEYLGMNPGDPAGLETLGMSYAVKKQPLQAEEYFLQALKSDPGRISTKLELARIYAITGKERQARALLGEVITREPKNSRAYYILAALETSCGNRDKALATYMKITEINPNDYIAIYRTGLINVQMGQLGKAEKTADYLQKKFKKKPEGYRLKGIIYFQEKNYAAAITELMNSIKMRPDVQAYYFLGLSLYHHGELENALSQFRKILDSAPSFVQAQLLTSIILLNQRRVDDSIAETNKVLTIDQNNALAHNLLGCAYMAKGMYDEGMKELNRATEIDPKIIDAYYKKGIFHLSTGRENEAETDFRTAVQVAPDSLNSRLILSSYYMRRNNSAKALSTLKDGLNGGKSDAVLYNNMAGISFAERKPAEGFAYLQKAKAVDPAFLASYFNTAIFYAVSGDHAKALNEYRTILQMDPKNSKAMISMAALLELTGRDKEAFNSYSNAAKTGTPAAYVALADYHRRKNSRARHSLSSTMQSMAFRRMLPPLK
jgi:putative PEP-CTERM system TPR-repeat lipoprotein